MLIQKSTELNVELNAKDNSGKTAFHITCVKGHSEIVEMLIQKSIELKIELNAKDIHGWTGFHHACCYGFENIVEIMVDNAEFFKLDLTAKHCKGRTGLDLAKQDKRFGTVNIIKRKIPTIEKREKNDLKI